MNYIQENLSINIKKYREEKGVTQAQLAKAVHVKPTSISSYEKGQASPSLEVLVSLALFFDCTLDDLTNFPRSINKKDETLNARIEAFEHIIIELKKEIDLLRKQQEIKELRELEPISYGDLEMLKFMSEAFNQKKIWKEKMNID